ncbi:unnamed protein product [Moneuplotes crassus]|uniref:Uncharacterized protein n=1 Tax=Euplotes crassus TaxID=5936 RepID=A0AAD1XWH9_EUPCR|nr:unnamed protein product [Moneuplotes crassus]
MKYQTFFLIALLMMAFATQAQARDLSIDGLKQDMAACAHDLYEGAMLLYKCYNLIKDEKFGEMIFLFPQFQILGPKIMTDCMPEEAL